MLLTVLSNFLDGLLSSFEKNIMIMMIYGNLIIFVTMHCFMYKKELRNWLLLFVMEGFLLGVPSLIFYF